VTSPFAPPAGGTWVRVSSKLATMRRLILVAVALVAGGLLSVLAWSQSSLAGAVCLAVVVAGTVWGWFVIGRNCASWGYAERVDDLLVTHGALFKKLVVVPYGRMQRVDLDAGPIERAFGLTQVKLHTAAATTDARVVGLLPEDAAALRDRLTALGEAHAAGL